MSAPISRQDRIRLYSAVCAKFRAANDADPGTVTADHYAQIPVWVDEIIAELIGAGEIGAWSSEEDE